MAQGGVKAGEYDWSSELQPGETLLWVGQHKLRPDKVGPIDGVFWRVLLAIPVVLFGLLGLSIFLASLSSLVSGEDVGLDETSPDPFLFGIGFGGLLVVICFGAAVVLSGYPLHKRSYFRSQHFAITDRRVLRTEKSRVTRHPLRANMTVTSSAIDGGRGNIYIFNPMENGAWLPTRATDLKGIADCPPVVSLLREIIAGMAEPERQDSRSWEDYLVEVEHVHWYGESDKKGPSEESPAAYAIVDNKLLTMADNKLTVLPITDDLEITARYGDDDFGTMIFISAEGSVSFEAISGCAQVVKIVEEIKLQAA